MEQILRFRSMILGVLCTKRGKEIDLEGQDMAVYEETIREFVEEEKLRYRIGSKPFNLMNEYDEDSVLKEKVERIDIQIQNKEGILYNCADLTLKEPLNQQEIEKMEEFLKDEYYVYTWGSGLEKYAIPVAKGEIIPVFRLYEGMGFIREVLEKPQKKYEITDLAHPKYPWLHRIRALKDVNEKVPKGKLGGFVESENNLSHEGKCWIYDQAICCEQAVVEKNAALFQSAVAKGQVLVYGNAAMYDHSFAEGECHILAGTIKDRAWIRGDARISADKKTKSAPVIAGESEVFGSVHGNVLVNGFIGLIHVVNYTEEPYVFTGGRDSIVIEKKNPKRKKSKNKKQTER